MGTRRKDDILIRLTFMKIGDVFKKYIEIMY